MRSAVDVFTRMVGLRVLSKSILLLFLSLCPGLNLNAENLDKVDLEEVQNSWSMDLVIDRLHDLKLKGLDPLDF